MSLSNMDSEGFSSTLRGEMALYYTEQEISKYEARALEIQIMADHILEELTRRGST